MTARHRPLCVVTGGTGYIGRHLLEHLVREGDYDIVALCRRRPQQPQAGVVYATVDDWTLSGLTAALDQADGGAFAARPVAVTFHLAGYGVAPGARAVEEMARVNASLPATMAAFSAARAGRLITAGSNAEYADPSATGTSAVGLINEDAPLQSVRLYGAAKAAGWLTAAAAAHALGISHLHLRIFNVYGPFEPQHRLTASIMQAYADQKRAPLSDGLQLRDFIHVDDVVKAFLAAARADVSAKGGRAINICTGEAMSVRRFAELMASALGASPQDLLGFGDIARRPDDIEQLVGDPSRAADYMGWRASLPVEEGIRQTIMAMADAHETKRALP